MTRREINDFVNEVNGSSLDGGRLIYNWWFFTNSKNVIQLTLCCKRELDEGILREWKYMLGAYKYEYNPRYLIFYLGDN